MNACTMKIIGFGILVVVPVLATGCTLSGKPDPADRFQRPEEVLDFASLFAGNCAACHGRDGLIGVGPPLHDDLFRAIVPTEVVEQVLKEGRAGTLMPAFARKKGGTLTEAQLQILAHEIKGVPYRVERTTGESATLAKVVADEKGIQPSWGIPKPAPNAPAYLADDKQAGDWQAGKRIFQTACAGCHGEQGKGIVKNDQLRMTINSPPFLGLNSNQLLRRYIITGRPDLQMPDYQSNLGRGDKFTPLTSQQIVDLTALLAYWRMGGETNVP
jgi:mono/diheme cytochrome c family protein